MAKKRAIIGFKGIALAEVTENTITAYKTEAAVAIPFAGSMTRTPKETVQDIFYDDNLYAQVKDVSGEDVEVRVGEVTLEKLAELGLGTYDADKNQIEADFNVTGREYALRCIADTVDGMPFYFNWRVFDLTGIRFDNFTTKGASITVCEVILTGVFKRPNLASAKPYAIRQTADDASNLAELDAWLAAAETLPAL